VDERDRRRVGHRDDGHDTEYEEHDEAERGAPRRVLALNIDPGQDGLQVRDVGARV